MFYFPRYFVYFSADNVSGVGSRLNEEVPRKTSSIQK